MTGFDSQRKIAMDRLDDDDVQIYAQPTLKGKIMTEDEAQTLAALKYAASMGYPSSMLKDVFNPFIIKRDVVMAQPEQEPVATLNISRFKNHLVNHDFDYFGDLPDGTHLLYTTPPKRPWVGLTDEEKHEIRYSHMTSAEFIEFIEAKLKEKNT